MTLNIFFLFQSRNDPYRLLVYDVVSAVHLSGHKQPLLLQRHNAVPGMFMVSISKSSENIMEII